MKFTDVPNFTDEPTFDDQPAENEEANNVSIPATVVSFVLYVLL